MVIQCNEHNLPEVVKCFVVEDHAFDGIIFDERSFVDLNQILIK